VSILRRFTLLTVFISLVITCCSEVGNRNLFSLEKEFFKAKKLADKKLSIKPELAGDADYDEVIQAYLSVVESYERDFGYLASKDSFDVDESKAAHMGGESLIEAARLYQISDRDEKCKELLYSLPDKFPHNRDHKALARLQLGRMEELEGNPLKAEEIYSSLLDDFYPPCDLEMRPNVDVLALPVRMARMFLDLEDQEKYERYLDYAEDYYTGIIEKFKYSPLGMSTIRHLAETYQLRGKPNEAIKLLETVKDSTGAVTGTAQLLIADIYGTELGDLGSSRKAYNEILNRESDTLLHPRVELQLAKIEFIDSNFAECRRHVGVIKDKYTKYRNILSRAQQLLAMSFEAEGDFNRAYSEYQWLLTNYPESIEAVDTYAKLPEYIRSEDQEDLADQWQEKSADKLKQIRDSKLGSPMGLLAQTNLINLLANQEAWAEAAEELEFLQETYPRSQAGTEALFKAGNIYQDKLKDAEKARATYERQVNLYPDMPITKKAKQELK
jgi:tetratricopeptide (TPR) repeat protein